jgi:hypothetical protein
MLSGLAPRAAIARLSRQHNGDDFTSASELLERLLAESDETNRRQS